MFAECACRSTVTLEMPFSLMPYYSSSTCKPQWSCSYSFLLHFSSWW